MSFKEAQLATLPTEKATDLTPILHTSYTNKFNFPDRKRHGNKIFEVGFEATNKEHQPYHLYVLLDEEIKKGDWVGYPNLKNWVPTKYLGGDLTGNERKIIATTDTSLTIPCVCGNSDFHSCLGDQEQNCNIKLLLQPSQSFIEKYISEYNKGNIITDVWVEYESYHGINTSIAEINYISGDGSLGWKGRSDLRDFRLKINPSDNTITIRIIKDNFTLKELEDALVKHYLDIGSSEGCNLGQDVRVWTKKWIEENL